MPGSRNVDFSPARLCSENREADLEDPVAIPGVDLVRFDLLGHPEGPAVGPVPSAILVVVLCRNEQSPPIGRSKRREPCDRYERTGETAAEACTRCGGDGQERIERTLTVDIPAGIESGQTLQLRDRGDVGSRGGPPGDLLVDVQVDVPARGRGPAVPPAVRTGNALRAHRHRHARGADRTAASSAPGVRGREHSRGYGGRPVNYPAFSEACRPR